MTATKANPHRMYESVPVLEQGRHVVDNPYDTYNAVPVDDAFVRYVDGTGRVLVQHSAKGERQNLVTMSEEELKKVAVKEELLWIEAPDLETIAADLLESRKELHFASQVRIAYRWVRKGGKVDDRYRYEAAERVPSKLQRELGIDYFVWLAADHIRSAGVIAWHVEAMLYHALMHVTGGRPRPHEFSGFRSELTYYGPWRYDLRVAAVAVQQLALLSDEQDEEDVEQVISDRVQAELDRLDVERPTPPWMSSVGAIDDDEGDEG